MLVLPLPPWIVDIGVLVSLASAIVIVLISTNVDHPLRFSTFPSLLLLTTLLRLGISIAATKLILGSAQGGHVIEAFGNFVMGGDFVVGLVAFSILVIVQFVVITNGAGRVSEVVARFTLDAMPGKQMAIDADLNAGLISDVEAKRRRREIKEEADFYGAMDGASKFIKGDAIASVLIILVNIVGGMIVGFLRGQGSVMDILQTYALLSVGEGLVSQLPALLISTSAGLLVTRSGQESGMGTAVMSQVFAQPKALAGAASGLLLLAFVPGFPVWILLGMAACGYGLYRYAGTLPKASSLSPSVTPSDSQPNQDTAQGPAQPESVLPLLNVDPIELEIGYGLTKLADPRQGGDLPQRVTAVRRQLALEYGFVLPSVRIRDNMQLPQTEYIIRIRGEEVARGTLYPDNYLAIDGGAASDPVTGTATRDPVFGINAYWIERGLREQAERSGYTVIEPSAVVSTHLSELVKSHAAELLSRQDVQNLLDNVKEINTAAVEELVPAKMSVGEVQKVLQHLLRERVPIRDLVTILETMADFCDRVKEPDQLGELVRSSIPRTLTRQHLDESGKLYCVAITPELESFLANQLQQTPYGSVIALEPNESNAIADRIRAELDRSAGSGQTAVILCGTKIRLPLKRLLERHGITSGVLAFNEVAASAEVEFVGQVRPAA